MNHWYRTTIAACALASAALASLAATSDKPMAFTACMDNDDPPFSAASSPDRGVDVEIAQAIAARMGRPLRLVWVQVSVRGGLGKALKQTIEAGQCDAYFSIPSGVDMALELSERRLVATRPYLTVGYLFVSAPGSKPVTAADVRSARRVGAVTATPADLHLHEQQFNRRPYANNPALIAALQRHTHACHRAQRRGRARQRIGVWRMAGPRTRRRGRVGTRTDHLRRSAP